MSTTYRLIDLTRDLLSGEEVRIVLMAGLSKPAAKKALALARRSNVIGPDAVRLGRTSVALLEAEAVAA